MVMHVEKLVLLFAESGKKLLYRAVFLRQTDCACLIGIVKACGAGFALARILCSGLAAAEDTSAGACHDLNEVEMLARLDGVEQSGGVAEAADDCDLQLLVAERNGSFLNALETSYANEGDLLETLLGGVGDIRIDRVATKEEIFEMLDFVREC